MEVAINEQINADKMMVDNKIDDDITKEVDNIPMNTESDNVEVNSEVKLKDLTPKADESNVNDDVEIKNEMLKVEMDVGENDLEFNNDDDDDEEKCVDIYQLRKPSLNGYKCSNCSKRFNTKTGVLNHMRVHLIKTLYHCALCKKQFKSNNELIKHKEEHSNENQSYICKICELAFTNRCDWLIHDLTHSHKTLFKCDECTQYFKLKFVYKTHISIHYDLKLPCPKCPKKLKSESVLIQHLAKHDQTYMCFECGENCSSKHALSFHMTKHTGVKPYQCLYCGKAFRTACAKKIHTRVHTNERPFKCNLCNRAFKQSTDLDRHPCKFKDIRVPCEVCSRKLLPESLPQHMLLHSDYKPFPCKQCDKAFVSFLSLKAHTIYKHSDEKPYACTFCSMKFKINAQLNRHIRTVHKHDIN